MSAAVHNRAQFEKTIERLIVAADQANRGGDLDRAVTHIAGKPLDVSRLAAFVMVIDDDIRPELSAAIDAFRRFKGQQNDPVDDDQVIEIMHAVYERIRA
ncbi:MAG: hypothetical protein ACJAYU_000129 [Bradymonadia bacterium]|jgi:hypothetical protein